MREKIRLIIIIGLAVMLAISIFIGQQTYTAKKAIEQERNGLRNENEMLARKLEGIAKERRQLQEKVDALSNDLDRASQEKEDIRKQYESLVKDRDEMAEKLKTLQRNNEQLNSDLSNMVREKQRLGQSLESNLASIKEENAQLKQQLDNLNALKNTLETELGKLKGDKSDLERKFNDIDSFLEQKLARQEYLSLKEQIGAIRSGGQAGEEAETQAAGPEKESVELPPIVVKPQTLAQAETPAQPKKSAAVKPTGTVLEVNKENKFVIIDLGQEAGIKLGDTFQVYKQGRPIGTIEVVQVRKSICAGDIKEEITPIEAGDIVR